MRRTTVHLIFWLIYVLLYGYIATPFNSLSYLPVWERLLRGFGATFTVLPVNLLYCYGIIWFIAPLYQEKKRLYLFGGIFTLFCVGIYRLIMDIIISPYFYLKDLSKLPATPVRFTIEWLLGLLGLLSPLAILGVLELLFARAESAEREKNLLREKLQSELNFLRAQTNPHFLFNTLNNLYHLARKQSEKTPDSILRLSGMMRYMLYECSTPRVPIAKEITLIQDYLALEMLRYNERLSVEFTTDIDDDSQPIAPLLLLPIVENCFKHGAAESNGNVNIHLSVVLKNKQLKFIAENSHDSHIAANDGIGITNVRRQLELLYADYSLHIEPLQNVFRVEIRINLANEIPV